MPTGNEILIHHTAHETRVALTHNASLTELHVEREISRGLVGNIYLGKVTRVLPGMQSAFIDIGLDKAAFLHVADLWQARLTSAQKNDEADLNRAEQSNAAPVVGRVNRTYLSKKYCSTANRYSYK
jgi:ribonuclease G